MTNISSSTPIPQLSDAILNGVKKDFIAVSNRNIWDDVLITQEPPKENILIEIGGTATATAGNHSLILGKKKSRKTLFIIWLASLCRDLVMVFDTEQGKTHVWRVKDKIRKLCGKDVPTFYLRGKSPAERRDIIYGTIKSWPIHPQVIIIDGIRDLLSNINDADQSTDLITWLEKITIEFDVHIINVLHLNKTDGNARGHIGSELLNKAQTTIELELDEKAGVTLVKCESSRDRPFESFAFTHGEDDLPVIVSMPIKGNTITEAEEKARLNFVFEDGILKRSEVVENIKNHFECGRDKADKLLAKFSRNGWIVKSGKDRSPDAVYKLGI